MNYKLYTSSFILLILMLAASGCSSEYRTSSLDHTQNPDKVIATLPYPPFTKDNPPEPTPPPASTPPQKKRTCDDYIKEVGSDFKLTKDFRPVGVTEAIGTLYTEEEDAYGDIYTAVYLNLDKEKTPPALVAFYGRFSPQSIYDKTAVRFPIGYMKDGSIKSAAELSIPNNKKILAALKEKTPITLRLSFTGLLPDGKGVLPGHTEACKIEALEQPRI